MNSPCREVFAKIKTLTNNGPGIFGFKCCKIKVADTSPPPSTTPTTTPTRTPTTANPTVDPTIRPTAHPTVRPTTPTGHPTSRPTNTPTQGTMHPTRNPTTYGTVLQDTCIRIKSKLYDTYIVQTRSHGGSLEASSLTDIDGTQFIISAHEYFSGYVIYELHLKTTGSGFWFHQNNRMLDFLCQIALTLSS